MIGCLCLHGFTGGPYELEPVIDYIKEHTDWKIVCPTFPGHENKNQFTKVPYRDWIKTAEKSYADLREDCDKIYVIGFSMGGVIAGYLAAKYNVDKLVLLSPAAYYINPKQLVVDIFGMLKALIQGRASTNELWNRYKRKIRITPFSMTVEFRKLIRKLRPNLKNITSPTLILYGEKDGVVPKKSVKFIHDNLQCNRKHLHFLAKSKHVICHDVDKKELLTYINQFLLYDKFAAD